MKAQPISPSRLLPILASVFFVMMTLVFLTVPYVMARHPGELGSHSEANYSDSRHSVTSSSRR